MKDDDRPDRPPSALKESIKKAEILNFMFTGQPPSEYQVDAGKLVGAVWGIFSDKIAPDVARESLQAWQARGPATGPVCSSTRRCSSAPAAVKAADPSVVAGSRQH